MTETELLMLELLGQVINDLYELNYKKAMEYDKQVEKFWKNCKVEAI